jgi:FkbM family methyltransferase
MLKFACNKKTYANFEACLKHYLMKRKGEFLKLFLFKTLSFENYLYALSKIYFLSYNLGLLKKRPLYKYHYFLKSFIKEKDTVIDIGANLGYFTVYFSGWVGSEGVVYAVEPVESVRKILIKNTKKYKNVRIIPYALGEFNKDIEIINTSRQSKGFIASGSNFIVDGTKPITDENIDKFNAVMRKGSELFGGLSKIDFIKCDVEGYETNIIPELEILLKKHEPLMLIETRREKRIFLQKYLSDLGFQGFVLENGKLYHSVSVKEKEEDDILFIPESKLNLYSEFIGN